MSECVSIRRFICTACLVISLTGCLIDSDDTNEEWNLTGLKGEYINALKIHHFTVYAATRSDLYRKKLVFPTGWKSMGIKSFIDGREVRDFVVFNEKEVLTGVGSHPEFEKGTIPLWKTSSGGDNWIPFQNGFGDEKGNYNAFARIDATPSNDTLYARAGGSIARSVDRGNSWKLVRGNWRTASFPQFIRVDNNNPETIWTGGGTVIFTPRLLKSADACTTWTDLPPIEDSEADVYDVAIHPIDSDCVMVGLAGFVDVIRRTEDGGETWQTIYEDIETFALARSPRKENRIYASGRNAKGTLFFLKSDDFGSTWETIEYESGPTEIWATELAVAIIDGQDVLYLGTNKGVYSYSLPE